MSDLVTSYLACWNETDPARRRSLLEQHWSADATYTDPLADVRGLDGIDAVIGAVQAQFAGFAFTAGGPVDAHHDQTRFTWNLGPADAPTGAEPVVVGFDVVLTDADGRIRTVLGFLDRVPA